MLTSFIFSFPLLSLACLVFPRGPKKPKKKKKKQYNRRTDYVALFSFLVFVSFYLSILYLQRSAEEAYMLTSTLKSALIPEDSELSSSQARIVRSHRARSFLFSIRSTRKWKRHVRFFFPFFFFPSG